MKKLIFVLFLLIASNCYAAELLIKAKPHWMDVWDAAKVSSLTAQELQSYNARSQIGDIIVVRPDDWQWGKEERLPNFIIIKIPTLSMDLVKQYEESLIDNTILDKPIMLKVRKWKIPLAYVDMIKQAGGVITINKTTLLNKIQAKTQ